MHDLEGGEVLEALGDGVAPGEEEGGVEGTLQVPGLVLQGGLEPLPVLQQEPLEVTEGAVLQQEVDLVLTLE